MTSSMVPFSGDYEPSVSGEMLEAAKKTIETPSETTAEIALHQELGSVYLGALGNGRFRDEHTTPVPEAGILVKVSQNSAGYTGIAAGSLEGYKVEALDPDASSRKTMWKGIPEGWDDVTLQSYWDTSDRDGWGTAGQRGGVVRVTSDNGDTRLYKVSADFQGRSDSWHVKGEIHEIWATDHPELSAPIRELGAGALSRAAVDPSAATGNLVKPAAITASTISALEAAFIHATPGIDVLGASKSTTTNTKKFAELGLDLLLATAKSDPELMDGTEEMVDKLGHSLRLIENDFKDGRQGILSNLDDDDKARVDYLQSIRDFIGGRYARSEDAWHLSHVAQESIEIMKKVLAKGAAVFMEEDAELLDELKAVVEADLIKTHSIKAQRDQALAATVLDSTWEREGIEYRAVIPGQKATIKLDQITPLLTPEQTMHAYFVASKSRGGSFQASGINAPTLLQLEVNGNTYALIDLRNVGRGSYHVRKTSDDNMFDDERLENTFALLQLLDDTEDPRYGLRVNESKLLLDNEFAGGKIQKVRDATAEAKPVDGSIVRWATAHPETGVVLEFDTVGNRIIIMGDDKRFGITAHQGVLEVGQKEAVDKVDEKLRQKYREWEVAVAEVQKDTERLRSRLESDLEARIMQGDLSEAQIAERRSQIEATVAQGPYRSRTYNGFSGDKWHRSQGYTVTVDVDGNIWGDFEAVNRHDPYLTGKPLAPGRHLLRRKPSLNPVQNKPNLSSGENWLA